MNRIFTFILAAIAITTAAVTPQDVQAENSGITKAASSTPVAYIGSDSLFIPTKEEGTKRYTYKETGTDSYSGSTLMATESTTNYNVAVTLDADNTLRLSFNNLTVTKCNQFKRPYDFNHIFNVLSIVRIDYSGKTVLTLENKNSLTAVNSDNAHYNSGLYSEGNITIRGTGTLETNGGQSAREPSNSSNQGLYARDTLVIDLSGTGKIVAKGYNKPPTGMNAACVNTYGLFSEKNITISGNGTIEATGGLAQSHNFGLSALNSLTINMSNGGKVTAAGNISQHLYSGGIYAGNIDIKGTGRIEAYGGPVINSPIKLVSCGLYTGALTIALKDTAKLTAAAGEANSNISVGLYLSNGDSYCNIKSGNVTFKGQNETTMRNRGFYYPTVYNGATITASMNFDGSNPDDISDKDLTSHEILFKHYKYFHVEGIAPIDIADATITGIEKSYEYTGSAIKPVPTVTLEGKTLVAGIDYTVAYKDSIEVGTATITITGINDYGSTKDITFLITPFDIAKTTVEGIDPIYDYTGSAIKPAVSVKHNTMTLTEGTDYTVAYNDSIEIGTATVIITGIGNYTGTQKITFEIMALDIADATIEGIDKSYEYTGSAITPVPTVTLNGKTLKEGTDYTVSYGANKQPGTATVMITGIGIYKGTQTVKFNINRKPVTYYVTLPQVEGATTTPAAGVHAVKSGETFTFTITLDADYSDSKPIVKLFGKTITPNLNGQYVINNISYDADITITGVTKNTATAIDGVNGKTVIWASKGSLKIHTATPQQMQVISLVGSTVLMRNIPAGDTTIDTLSAGFYIVRLSGGTIEKVMIR